MIKVQGKIYQIKYDVIMVLASKRHNEIILDLDLNVNIISRMLCYIWSKPKVLEEKWKAFQLVGSAMVEN